MKIMRLFAYFLLSFIFLGCQSSSNNTTKIPTVNTDVNISETVDTITNNDIVNGDLVEEIDDKIDTNTSSKTYCSDDYTNTELLALVNGLDASADLSKSLLVNSQDLLKLSKSLDDSNPIHYVDPKIYTQESYVRAMLQLSQDILSMANKIGEMSDRILIMAGKIGDMADRIVETQNIQNANVALTQKNILEAQKNFNNFLNP